MKIFQILYNKFFYRPNIKGKLAKVGANFRISYSSELFNPQYFSIGDNFFAGPYGYFGTNRNNFVTIGNHVMLGPFCKIIGGNHDYRYTENHMYFNQNIDHMKSEIIIEDGVWIGANSIILSNSKISEGAVIGAMSLVVNYIPPYCIALGIPAKKFIKRFDKKEDLIKLLKNTNSKYSIEEVDEIYNIYNLSY